MRTHIIKQRGFNLDYLMWVFTRLSGLGLLLMGAIGIVTALVMGARLQMDLGTLVRWTFFPNPNHVINSDIPDVTMGWANAFWQIMQMLVASLGITHGMNGLRTVLEDYLSQSWLQTLLRGLIFLLWLFFVLAAIYVILAS